MTLQEKNEARRELEDENEEMKKGSKNTKENVMKSRIGEEILRDSKTREQKRG